jgi:hypothetical protein
MLAIIQFQSTELPSHEVDQDFQVSFLFNRTIGMLRVFPQFVSEVKQDQIWPLYHHRDHFGIEEKTVSANHGQCSKDEWRSDLYFDPNDHFVWSDATTYEYGKIVVLVLLDLGLQSFSCAPDRDAPVSMARLCDVFELRLDDNLRLDDRSIVHMERLNKIIVTNGHAVVCGNRRLLEWRNAKADTGWQEQRAKDVRVLEY